MNDRPLSDRVLKMYDEVNKLHDLMEDRAVSPMLVQARQYLRDAANYLDMAKDAVDEVYEALEDLSAFSNSRPDAPCGQPTPGTLNGAPYGYCRLPLGHEGSHYFVELGEE